MFHNLIIGQRYLVQFYSSSFIWGNEYEEPEELRLLELSPSGNNYKFQRLDKSVFWVSDNRCFVVLETLQNKIAKKLAKSK